MTEELQKAVELLRDGDILAARRLLSDIVKVDPNNEQAWLWLSSAVTDEERRRECLERVLQINPGNQAAHLALVALSQPPELPPEKKPQFNPEPQPPGFGSLRESATAAFRSVSMHRRESAPVVSEISKPVDVPQAVLAPASKAVSPSRILGNVWINPTGRPDKIVVLHDNSLIVSNPGRRTLRRFESDVTAGMLHLDMLGKDMLLIPYNSITRIIADEHKAQLIVRFRGGRRMLSENIRFAGTGLRDEVFQAIKDDAGSRFDLIHVRQGGFWRSVPYILFAGLLSYLTYDSTAITMKIAKGWTFPVLESTPQLKAIAVQFAQSYGPASVIIFGAMLVITTLLWVMMRASKPREMPVLRAR
ncbi:MAG: hypothetical protein JXB07_02675 [Anaerolineae bacterium]|nr:hypothetical protein [Anaerolineae bacterium]